MRPIETDSNLVFLSPAEYVDSDHPSIRAESARICRGHATAAEKARAIYYAVREHLYRAADFADLESYRASSVLADRRRGTARCRPAD